MFSDGLEVGDLAGELGLVGEGFLGLFGEGDVLVGLLEVEADETHDVLAIGLGVGLAIQQILLEVFLAHRHLTLLPTLQINLNYILDIDIRCLISSCEAIDLYRLNTR